MADKRQAKTLGDVADPLTEASEEHRMAERRLMGAARDVVAEIRASAKLTRNERALVGAVDLLASALRRLNLRIGRARRQLGLDEGGSASETETVAIWAGAAACCIEEDCTVDASAGPRCAGHAAQQAADEARHADALALSAPKARKVGA